MSRESDPQKKAPEAISSGVEELIDRLKADGVAAGREQADELLQQARAKAAQLLEEKKAEADQYRTDATAEIQAQRKAAASALQQATRDSLLQLEKQVQDVFGRRIEAAVRRQLDDPDYLRSLVLAAAHRAGAELPDDVQAVVEVPEASVNGDAAGSMLGITREMLREGVELAIGDHTAGIVLRLTDQDVAIDLSHDALAKLVMEQLAPSFRDLLRGHLESDQDDA